MAFFFFFEPPTIVILGAVEKGRQGSLYWYHRVSTRAAGVRASSQLFPLISTHCLYREVIKRSSVPIDTVLSYCRYSLNDVALEDHLAFFKASFS